MATVQLTAEARPECIRPLRSAVERLAIDAGFSDAEASSIKLCVSEAVANTVVHAYPPDEPGSVSVLVSAEDDALEVDVVDEGRAVYGVRDRDDERHLGFPLITRLATHCTFTAANDGTRLEMLFSRPRRQPSNVMRRSRERIHPQTV